MIRSTPKSKGPGGQPEPSQNITSNNAPDRTAPAASSPLPAIPMPLPVPGPALPLAPFQYCTLAEVRAALADADGSPMEQLETACRIVVEAEASMKIGESHTKRGYELHMRGRGLTEQGDQLWSIGNRIWDDAYAAKKLAEAATVQAAGRLLDAGTL